MSTVEHEATPEAKIPDDVPANASAPVLTQKPDGTHTIHSRDHVAAELATSDQKMKDELEGNTDGPRKTPFLEPSEASVLPAAVELTPEQQEKYDALLKEVEAWTEIPDKTAKDFGGKGPLTDKDRMWLTRECLLRYLRAVKWNAVEAPKRLMGTLTWRHEYGVDEHTADYISVENETGKQVVLGYDNGCRPCLYLNPGKQNTKKSDRQVQHLVFMIENVIHMQVAGQDTLSLLINFAESSSGQNPSVTQGREVLNILQTHYPERLGRALIINSMLAPTLCIFHLLIYNLIVPWFITLFFKAISPFIDPATKSKMIFNQDLRNHVPPQQLLKLHFGGDVDFEYSHDVYWPTFNKIVELRKKAEEERWIKAGKRIGESELYLKGKEGASSLSELEKEKAAIPAATTAADSVAETAEAAATPAISNGVEPTEVKPAVEPTTEAGVNGNGAATMADELPKVEKLTV
jgi:CRAL/TRIO domain/CRAL/TRIO, N-terminal domain